tara:strand:+ start:340 stop:561 length:222 start_codon:yes stop_codon:yes gene_type:complete
MRITLEFNTDNDAFYSNETDSKINPHEVNKVLEQAKRQATQLIETNWDYNKGIMDHNGNYVGTITIHSEKIGV